MAYDKKTAEILYPFLERCKKAGFTDEQSQFLATEIYQLIMFMNNS